MTRAGTAELHRGRDRRGGQLLRWTLAAGLVALLHNRLWATPNIAFFTGIAENLGERPFGEGPEADYLLTNLALPAFARLIGQTAPHEYARLHLLVLIAGLAVCVALASRHHGDRVARNLTVLLAAAPGVTVVMQWLGQPDALTFPLGVMLALLRSRLALVATAVLLGLTHPEQGVVIVVVAAAVRLLLDAGRADATQGWAPQLRAAMVELGAMAGGVVLGRLVVEIYLRVNDIQILRPRSQFVGLGVDLFLEHHMRNPMALLYLLLGPLWLVVIGVVVARVAENRRAPTRQGTGSPSLLSIGRTWTLLGVLAVVLLVPVAVTLDETRVYAMLTAPLLTAVAVTLDRDAATRVLTSRWALVAFLALVAVVPGGFTAGVAAWSTDLPAREMARFLVDGHHPGDLDAWLFSPFSFIIPAGLLN